MCKKLKVFIYVDNFVWDFEGKLKFSEMLNRSEPFIQELNTFKTTVLSVPID